MSATGGARHGDTCGCCIGLEPRTPAVVSNAPGLQAIAYRAGTWASFRETLLARFTAIRNPSGDGLDSRSAQNFAAALADAWAVAGDILTFYQERIANESYLRTATERRSVLELARMIGYELRPGVAAEAWLAFTIDPPPAPPPPGPSTVASAPLPARRDAVLDARLRVQSVPGPDEKPQTFETVERIVAWPEWNAIPLRVRQPETIDGTSTVLYLDGEVALLGGDHLLLELGPSDVDTRRVKSAVFDPASRTTQLELESADPPDPAPPPQDYEDLSASRLIREIVALTAENVRTEILTKKVAGKTVERAWHAEDLAAICEFQRWEVDELENVLRKHAQRDRNAAGVALSRFATRASVFGHNAVKHATLPDATKPHVKDADVETLASQATPAGGTSVTLDTIYPSVAKGSRVLVAEATVQHLQKATDLSEVSYSEFLITARATRIVLDSFTGISAFEIRTTTIFATPVALPPGTEPVEPDVDDPVTGAARQGLRLDGAFVRLRAGRRVVIIGRRTDLAGQNGTEQRTITAVRIEGGVTTIFFDAPLAYTYDWTTVTVNANVAPATHGESTRETLGSGDAAREYQTFALRQSPVTHTSAPTPSGTESSLRVFVNDVEWHEAERLFGRASDERIFATRRADDGTTTVQFGDGVTGARLPTGVENIRAEYRKGIGLGGLVRADQLTLLLSRPLGVKGTTNPLPASGAADPESRDDARRNAPLQVLTLGRAVSLRDFEDFARGFAGVAKAHATRFSGREKPGVFVSVAAPNGAPFARIPELAKALRSFGDPFVPIVVRPFRGVLFTIEARVAIDPDHLPDVVRKAVDAALHARYSFDAQAFAQPVFRSEAVAVVQRVEGVRSALVTLRDAAGRIATAIPALIPFGEIDDSTPGAELLTLDPRPVTLTVTVTP